MKLSRESKIVKWAYFFTDSYNIPYQTSLCRIFWRCVLVTPLIWSVIIGISAGILYVIGYQGLYKHTKPSVIGVISSGLVVGYVHFFKEKVSDILRRKADKLDDAVTREVEKIANSTLWMALSAIKAKVCPIIVISDED